ncbi:hypothetical protein ILYODFUR_037012 [Ilyodon furcidens]|uniref:Uncharacterized protein n=1 Tax=Ilyodon furcidens TaxID=33524 RepID=A0ABV0T4E2_9TELE
MWVMLQTLDDDVPRHQDRLANPGLVVRPQAIEISYNHSEPTQYNPYVQQLRDLLQRESNPNPPIFRAPELKLLCAETMDADWLVQHSNSLYFSGDTFTIKPHLLIFRIQRQHPGGERVVSSG